MAAGAIVAVTAIVSAIVGGVGAGLSYKSQKEAAEKAEELANVRRGDELEQQGWSRSIANRQIRENRRQFNERMGFQREEADKNRKMKMAGLGIQQASSIVDRALGSARNDQAAMQNIANALSAKRRR